MSELRFRRARDYILIKFYIPDYAFQSPPYVIPANAVEEKGWKWAQEEARDWFLRDFLRHKGQGDTINPSHAQMWKDGRITYDAKLRRLTQDAVSLLKRMENVSVPKSAPKRMQKATKEEKVGWKRSFEKEVDWENSVRKKRRGVREGEESAERR